MPIEQWAQATSPNRSVIVLPITKSDMDNVREAIETMWNMVRGPVWRTILDLYQNPEEAAVLTSSLRQEAKESRS